MEAVTRRTRSLLPYVALAAVAVSLPALALLLRKGHAATPAAAPVAPASGIASPRLPSSGGVVLARESGRLAVVLSARREGRGRLGLTATVIGPSGSGATGLRVAFAAGGRRVAARACGSGCYAGSLDGSPRRVTVRVGGASVPFAFPARAPTADQLVRRVARSLRSARSLVIDERLASSPKVGIDARFEVAAPDRLRYQIAGGSDAIVIGARRWDRATPRERWVPSQQTPLSLPAVPWGGSPQDARVVSQTQRLWIVTLLDPQIPAWFELRVDKRTLRPAEVRMIAAAHFMRDRYSRYDEPLAIRPPRAAR
jgi:hypothetical protein